MLIAVIGLLCFVTLLPGQAGLTGTWVLDVARSDFGVSIAPKQFIVRLDKEGNRLAITTFTVDDTGKHISYQHAERDGLLLRVSTNISNTSENWRIISRRELIIRDCPVVRGK